VTVVFSDSSVAQVLIEPDTGDELWFPLGRSVVACIAASLGVESRPRGANGGGGGSMVSAACAVWLTVGGGLSIHTLRPTQLRLCTALDTMAEPLHRYCTPRIPRTQEHGREMERASIWLNPDARSDDSNDTQHVASGTAASTAAMAAETAALDTLRAQLFKPDSR
jgi:hypothetical protein